MSAIFLLSDQLRGLAEEVEKLSSAWAAWRAEAVVKAVKVCLRGGNLGDGSGGGSVDSVGTMVDVVLTLRLLVWLHVGGQRR